MVSEEEEDDAAEYERTLAEYNQALLSKDTT